MKKLTETEPYFSNNVTDDDEKYWWELNFEGCGLYGESFNSNEKIEVFSTVFYTEKERDEDWNKFAKLNGFNLIK